jgi:hypothetical protein
MNDGASAVVVMSGKKIQLLESFVSKEQGNMCSFNTIFKKLKATSRAERGIFVEIDD